MRKFIAKLAVLLAALLPVAAQADVSVTYSLRLANHYLLDGEKSGLPPTFVLHGAYHTEYFVPGVAVTYKSFEDTTVSPSPSDWFGCDVSLFPDEGCYADSWKVYCGTQTTLTTVSGESVYISFPYSWYDRYNQTDLYLLVSIAHKKYTITYNSNGGGWKEGQPTGGTFIYTKGGTTPGQSCAERTGHKFTGWNTKADGSGTSIGFDEPFTGKTFGITDKETPITLYAQWEVKQYDLTLTKGEGIDKIYYEVNGATTYTPITESATVKVNYNTTWRAYAEAKEGYKYTESSASNPKSGTMKESGATFAPTATKIKCEVSVTSAQSERGSVLALPSGSVDYGTLVKIEAFPNSGYDFKEWTSSIGLTTIYENPHIFTITQNVQFVAYFTNVAETVSIAVEAEPPQGGTVTGGGNYVVGATATLKAMPNEGYSFEKWTDDPSALATRSVVVSGPATYTANFTGNVYEVSFDPRPGTMVTEYRDVTFGKQYGNLPTPTPPQDKAFAGWYTNKTGGDKVEETTTVATAKDHTLYARYTEIVYADYYVAFNGNGATNETPMAVQKIRRDKATALTPNIYAKPGSTFAGWATNGMDVVAYTNCATVLNLAEADQTNTLKAVWAANTYTMRFAPNAATVLNPTAQGDISNCVSGAGVQLPPCQYVNLPSCGFDGWVNELNVTNKAGKVVTNYVEHAGDLVTYKAAWLGNSDLSAAVGLEVTALTNRQDNTLRWTSDGTCVGIKPEKGSKAEANRMAMLVKGPGSVVFHCKKGSEALDTDYLYLYVGYERPLITKLHDYLLAVTSDYQPYAIAITNSGIQAVTWDYTTSGHEEACLNDVFYVDDVRWIPDVTTYAVAFDPNGGSGSMEEQEMTVGVETALVSNAFTRADHNFLGWATNATGKVIYTDGAKVKNLAAPGEIATLYAVWERMDVGELSRAVGLNNAVLTTTGVKWTVATEEYRTGPECITCAPNNATTSKLFMAVEGPGIVQYYVKGAKNFKSTFNVYTNGVQYGAVSFTSAYPDKPLEISVAAGVTNVEWRFSGQGTGNKAYMDDVRWTPKGGKPKPLILFIK